MQNDERLGAMSAAKLVGVSVATLRRWVAGGSFPAPVVLGPHTSFWSRPAVEQWLRDRGVKVEGVCNERRIPLVLRGCCSPRSRAPRGSVHS